MKDIVAAYGVIWEDSGPTLLARILGGTGQPAVQTDFDRIDVGIFNNYSDTPDTALLTTTVASTNVIFNTLQTDARWTDEYGNKIDDIGYNFRHSPSSTCFATPSQKYSVEYLFTPSTGSPWHDVFEIEVKPIRRS